MSDPTHTETNLYGCQALFYEMEYHIANNEEHP